MLCMWVPHPHQLTSSVKFVLRLIYLQGNNAKELVDVMALARFLCPDPWALYTHIQVLNFIILNLQSVSAHGEKETSVFQSHLFPRS